MNFVNITDAPSMSTLGRYKNEEDASGNIPKKGSRKTTIEKGLKKHVNNHNRPFFRICNIIIERENKCFIQNCQDGLVKSSILSANNSGLRISDLMHEIRGLTELNSFPVSALNKTTLRLLKKQILFQQQEKYFLETTQFKLLRGTLDERKNTLIEVENNLVANVKEETKTNSDCPRIALNAFYEFLTKFYENGCRFSVNTLISNKISEFPRSSQDTLADILKKIEDEKAKQIIRNSILKTIQAYRKPLAKLLYEVAKNYIGLEILKVDPDGKKWKKITLSDKSFLLDTNVLFALVLIDHPKHKVTNKVISILKDLKINLLFTKRTLQEWLEVLEKANQRFKFINSTRPSLLKKLEDIFIYSYFKEKESNPSITWQEYYSRMTQIGLLAQTKNVNTFDKEPRISLDLKSQELLNILSNNVHRSAIKRQNEKIVKSKQVSEHDAYHLLLTRNLTEKDLSKERGPSFWFLTFDDSLLEVDEWLNNALGSSCLLPSSLHMDFVVPFIMPFVDLGIQHEKLSDIFMNLIIVNLITVPNGLSASKIVEILSPWLSYRSLSDEDLENVLKDERVVRLYNEFRETAFLYSEKNKDLNDRLRQIVEQKIWEILENKIHEVKNQDYEYY